mmetsp:Transcript_28825/g.60863  ORF Transcript_28825/g.60863 Transcript_28825/m.60863 type:complete len:220 (-) Transcript_28825:129-788(-)
MLNIRSSSNRKDTSDGDTSTSPTSDTRDPEGIKSCLVPLIHLSMVYTSISSVKVADSSYTDRVISAETKKRLSTMSARIICFKSSSDRLSCLSPAAYVRIGKDAVAAVAVAAVAVADRKDRREFWDCSISSSWSSSSFGVIGRASAATASCLLFLQRNNDASVDPHRQSQLVAGVGRTRTEDEAGANASTEAAMAPRRRTTLVRLFMMGRKRSKITNLV